MTTRRPIGRAVAALIAAAALALAATPATASSSDPVPPPTDAWYAVVNGEYYVPGDGLETATPTVQHGRGGSMVTPLLLDPVDSFQCNVRNNANHMVTSYTAKAAGGFVGGTVRLFCGTSTGSGYKHIRDQHQADWTAKMAKYGIPGTWDDFMDWATSESLKVPSRAVDQGSNKTCYTTPVTIGNSNGSETFQPRVIISRNNTLVITSIPGGGC